MLVIYIHQSHFRGHPLVQFEFDLQIDQTAMRHVLKEEFDDRLPEIKMDEEFGEVDQVRTERIAAQSEEAARPAFQ